MVAAEGSAAPGTEASGAQSESSTSEHDNTNIAHTSSSETEKGTESGSELVSNGHGTSDNGNTHTAEGEGGAVAVAVGTGVEENLPAGDVLTAEEADKAWEQYIVQVHTARSVCTVIYLQSPSHRQIITSHILKSEFCSRLKRLQILVLSVFTSLIDLFST